MVMTYPLPLDNRLIQILDSELLSGGVKNVCTMITSIHYTQPATPVHSSIPPRSRLFNLPPDTGTVQRHLGVCPLQSLKFLPERVSLIFSLLKVSQ